MRKSSKKSETSRKMRYKSEIYQPILDGFVEIFIKPSYLTKFPTKLLD